MTFSITARCPETGQFGIAITSSSIAVASRCSFVRAGVGAVATQNITDPRLGPRGLDLMEGGAGAEVALANLLDGYRDAEFRQLALVDRQGDVAHFSGAHTLGTHAVAIGTGAVAAGNLLAGTGVPAAMLAGFEATTGDSFPERLLAALDAGLAAGGEEGPIHSAGLLVVEAEAWPLIDLRVDWAGPDTPLEELRKLWQAWQPLMRDYLQRALDPARAPSYGVPGDR
jgi:uncharacterized Ntn-hydrolase superfamily protein